MRSVTRRCGGEGESIKINEKNIGKITSSTWSPYQICGVGIVHLDNNENGPGDIVDVKYPWQRFI